MRRTLFWIVLASLLLAACATPLNTTDPAHVAHADRSREQSPEATGEEIQTLVDGNNDFAFDLYHTITADHNDNLIYSPYSISLAFSMTYAGARSETEAQMAETFHYLPQDTQHAAFNALDLHLAALGDEEGPEEGDRFQLHIANATWGQENFPFREPYLTLLAEQYGAGVRLADFVERPDEAVEEINSWIAEQTEDHIQDLVSPSVITPQTRFVLANAIYFNASWRFPFDEDKTEDAPFTRLDGSEVTVPMMHHPAARVPYAGGPNYQAIRLPYAGNNAGMLIILPDEGAFEAVEAELDGDFIKLVHDQTETRDVTLAMPRFDFESDLDLKELLEPQMPAPFSNADFSGMVEGGGLGISEALHRATITVNEIGTEASAATVIAMEESAMERAEMTLDRPFIFAIMERETGTILFLGRVLDPTQQGGGE